MGPAWAGRRFRSPSCATASANVSVPILEMYQDAFTSSLFQYFADTRIRAAPGTTISIDWNKEQDDKRASRPAPPTADRVRSIHAESAAARSATELGRCTSRPTGTSHNRPGKVGRYRRYLAGPRFVRRFVRSARSRAELPDRRHPVESRRLVRPRGRGARNRASG